MGVGFYRGVSKVRLDTSMSALGHSEKEAYSKYLQSTKNITDSLLIDFNGYAVSQESAKLLKLGQQCMERMSDLINKLESYSYARNNEKSPDTSPSLPYQSLNLPSGSQSTPVNSYQPASGRDIRATMKSDNILTQKDNRKNRTVDYKDLGPLEVAQKKNQMLLAAYRARLKGKSINKGQEATMSLALQRRLAENMAVAKAREQNLLRKQQERHKRLQEEANRSLQYTIGMSEDELERRQLYSSVLQYEQNSKQLLSWRERLKSHRDTQLSQKLLTFIFSQQNHPLTQILLKYQYAAYNKLYPLIQQYMATQNTRPSEQCTENSRSNHETVNNNNHLTDTDISDLKLRIESPVDLESESSSPVSQMSLSSISTTPRSVSSDNKSETKSEYNSETHSSQDSSSIYNNKNTTGSDAETFVMISPQDSKCLDPVDIEVLEKEALQRHLVNIVEEVHVYLEKIRTMIVVSYEDLDTVEGRDVCYSCIEERFFKPVWPYIIALYRIVHKDKEDNLSSVMSDYNNCTPSDLGVGDKYCLLDTALPTPYSHPYEPAAKQLSSMLENTSPLTKLGCIVKASRLICKCVEEHFTNLGLTQSPNIGADDLLPILSYVILKSKRPELLAEAHALEEFIYEGYLMGEEGYCLTSLQTALCYVMTLDSTSPEQ